VDPKQSLYLIDDHIPFRQRGLDQVLLLLDFQFGSRQTPGPLWHTPGDDLPAVSAESLQRVGDLVVRLLGRLGAQADGSPAPGARSAAPARGRYSRFSTGSGRAVGGFGPVLAFRSGSARQSLNDRVGAGSARLSGFDVGEASLSGSDQPIGPAERVRRMRNPV
jgi:hypothetical protein